ncbi:MAG: hypothetical protein R3F62_01985 [Planctomycetota bacterium]
MSRAAFVPVLWFLASACLTSVQGEELTVHVDRAHGDGTRYELSLDVRPALTSRTHELKERLRRSYRKLKGQADVFAVVAGAELLDGCAGRRVRVEADVDRSRGTAEVRAVLSPGAVQTLTGVVVEEAAYTQRGKRYTAPGLRVGNATWALPGLHHFGTLSRVVGRELTVRGRVFDLDGVLQLEELAATMTEETTLARLATEYGGGVEGSPLVTTDHVLAAGEEVWVRTAHPIHYGDLVEVRGSNGREGLAIPEVVAPRSTGEGAADATSLPASSPVLQGPKDGLEDALDGQD